MRTLNILYWVLLITLWTFIEIPYMFLTHDNSKVAHKLMDKLRNSIWTKKEQMDTKIKLIKQRYAHLFTRLDMNYYQYIEYIKLRDSEIEKINNEYTHSDTKY